MLGCDVLPEAADADIIEGMAVASADKREYLAGTGQICEHNSVERDDNDPVRPFYRFSPIWPKSYEHCLFSHWCSLPYSVVLEGKKGAPMHNSSLLVLDYVGPAVGAAVFVLAMSFVKEPTRRSFNALFVAGASGVYLSGGFGVWE